MSSAPSASPQRYFCHQCERTVTLTPSPSSDLSCPICQGGFLEEFEIPNPNPNPNPIANPFPLPDPFSSLFPSPSPSTTSSFDVQHPTDLFSLLGFDAAAPTTRSPAPSSSGGAGAPEQFNPIHFLQSYFQSLMAGGANFHVVVESGPGGRPATLGDYFVGPGLEQLIQHLMDNDPNRYGTPPASKSVVESLPDVSISKEMLAGGDDEAQCAVCKDAFELGAEAKQMPCKHVFHKDCILPWLELHNSCPVCRYELPTDDPDYEDRRVAGNGTAGQGNSGVAEVGIEVESPGSARARERRFRISLPWPLGAQGPANEEGGNGSGSGGNANSSGSGGQNHGQRTRQEDLD